MAGQKYHCSNPKCKKEIASVVEIEGHEMIQIGSILVTKIDGACIHCGTKFYWSITEKMLEKIIESIKKR